MTGRLMIIVWLGLLGCGAIDEASGPLDASATDAPLPVDAAPHDGAWVDSGGLEDDAGQATVDVGLPDPTDAGVTGEWSALSAVLAQHCRRCHDGGRRRRVDRWSDLVGVMALQVEAPLVAPGDPDGSYLLAKLLGSHRDFCGRAGQPLNNCGRRMPPDGTAPSPDEQLRLRAWIAQGAPAE